MIPIGDDNRDRHSRSYVMWALLVTNVLVFIYQLTLSAPELERFIYAYGARPFEIANRQDIAPQIDIPIWFTVFTSMFMHGGWLHIAGNMLYLWVFGDNVEDAMGHLRFLIFYLLCGIGGAMGQVLIDTNSTVPMVGASGAIAGVLAGYLLLFPKRGVRVLVFLGIFVTVIVLPALLVIGFWMLLQFLSGFASLGPETAQTSGGVAYFAHIGGAVTGAVLVYLFRNPRRVARQKRRAYSGWD